MRGRRHIAICAALLWLLGVEVLPNVHLATHDGDHTHAADGSIVPDRAARLAHALAHANGEDHAHPAKKPGKPVGDGAWIAEAEHEHAANGVAHRAVALHQPPPPVTTPVSVPHAETWRLEAPHVVVVSVAVARPSARGPPIA